MRVGFLLRPGKPEAAGIASELAKGVAGRGIRIVALPEHADSIEGAHAVAAENLGAAIDVLVVVGGDGTFLHGASLVADHGVPLLGINLGSLGFMTHYGVSEAGAALDAACSGRLPVQERMRLRVTVRPGEPGAEGRNALNEAVVTQRGGPRLLDLSAELDGAGSTTYKADGLILSTPTGSTAYNLAAGGPILTPNLQAIVLTPICPHMLTNRPVVMRADAIIRVTNASATSVTVTADGQWSRDLAPGEVIEVRKADRPLRTFLPQSPFFTILRQKLSWGERQEG